MKLYTFVVSYFLIDRYWLYKPMTSLSRTKFRLQFVERTQTSTDQTSTHAIKQTTRRRCDEKLLMEVLSDVIVCGMSIISSVSRGTKLFIFNEQQGLTGI